MLKRQDYAVSFLSEQNCDTGVLIFRSWLQKHDFFWQNSKEIFKIHKKFVKYERFANDFNMVLCSCQRKLIPLPP